MKLLLCSLFMLIQIGLKAQDYIINWQNDTIKVTLPPDPKKYDLRPDWKYNNGFFQVAAVFNNDSIRSILPGEIKGYHRAKHGKGFLCDGDFVSLKAKEHGIGKTNTEGSPEVKWYFMTPEDKGKYASLYKIRVANKKISTYYYVVKHGQYEDGYATPVVTRKDFRKILIVPGRTSEMEDYINKNKNYGKMVMEYNRLMELEANNKK